MSDQLPNKIINNAETIILATKLTNMKPGSTVRCQHKFIFFRFRKQVLFSKT